MPTKIKTRKSILQDALNINNLKINFKLRMSFIPPDKLIDIGNNMVIYNERIDDIHAMGAIFGCMSRLIDGRGMIMLDHFFDLFPKNVKKFIIYHEIGHYINGDGLDEKQMKRETLYRYFGKLPKSECKADEFAVSILGADSVINSLAFLIKYTDISIFTKIEIWKRIRNIKRMIK